jgi:hypothetical protein
MEKRSFISQHFQIFIVFSNSSFFQQHGTFHNSFLHRNFRCFGRGSRHILRGVHNFLQQQKRRSLADATPSFSRQLHRDGAIQPDGRILSRNSGMQRQRRKRKLFRLLTKL